VLASQPSDAKNVRTGLSIREESGMDRIGNNRGDGFEALMAFMICLSVIGAGISIYFTGMQ